MDYVHLTVDEGVRWLRGVPAVTEIDKAYRRLAVFCFVVAMGHLVLFLVVAAVLWGLWQVLAAF